MGEHDLLIRHAVSWVETKKNKRLDVELLEQILDLRWHNDELADGEWPPGSAERLLLVTWPAYGPPPPQSELLDQTLDTFWGFLRATGRMSASSASPAELRKEARRTLPKMAAAYDDPARHSHGRVMADFGRSIGIELEGAESIEELQERLNRVRDAWNTLPREERLRLMPDASPKSLRGQAMTRKINDLRDEDEDEEVFRAGEPSASARDVREAPFVRQCLALADWVGSGRDVTQAGLLRPAVAREAYVELDLWPWERELEQFRWGRRGPALPDDPEVDRVLKDAALHSWHSAGDCLPLDRLWWPLVEAGVVEVGSRRVRRVTTLPTTDHKWQVLGLMLVASLCRRLGGYRIEPLMGMISMPALAAAPVAMTEVREWWDTRCPPSLRGSPVIDWQARLDLAMYHFADCGMFRVVGEEVHVTDFGRDCVGVLTGMDEDGEFDEPWDG